MYFVRREREESDAISIMHIKYDVEILGIFRLSVCVMEMRRVQKESCAPRERERCLLDQPSLFRLLLRWCGSA